jgi:hypothetical protein
MLRLIVLLLLLANGAFFAWSQGLLGAWGVAPAQQSEPQRLAQQVRPEALRILPPDEARRMEVAAAAPRPPECMQAGPLEEAQLAAIRSRLDQWPVGSWSLEPAVEPARWIVYMGKYPNAEALNKKRSELRGIGVSFEAPANPALEPGLSLGGFASEEAANQRLAALTERGVRTAHVVAERPELRGQMLKLPAVDDALRPRVEELKTALAARPLRACR